MKLRKATQNDLDTIKSDSLDVSVGILPELYLGDISFACDVGGVMVGCGGLVVFWNGVAEAWIMLSNKCNIMDDVDRTRMVLLIKHKLKDLIKEHKLWRIGAIIRPDFPKAVRLAVVLGFEKEGLLRKYAPDGSDRLVYGKVI